MALKLVVDAVERRIADNWTQTPVQGVNLSGRVPKDGAAFVVIQYPVANGEQLTVGAPGNNVYRETGAFRIIVNAVRGDGVQDGLAMADALAALFRGKNFYGVQTFAPDSPSIDDRNDDGKYFSLSFAVPYEADIFG